MGIGGGILLATVLYRQYEVSDLTDPLRIIGFALLFGGSILARRARSATTS